MIERVERIIAFAAQLTAKPKGVFIDFGYTGIKKGV
jgi:hypothetical protein